MINDIDRTTLKHADIDMGELKRKISSGNAIVFTGAGFSVGTSNILNEEPPMAKQLAMKLSVLSKLSVISDELMFASEYALEVNDHDHILDLLKDNYTINKVSDFHRTICNLPWKRFYTTNYDNSIEFSSLFVGKRIESLNINSDPINYVKKPNVCLHINGKIEGSTKESLISDIKLSDASYLSPNGFTSSKWTYTFKRDLEKSSAIVFLGYSMYDIDIKRILFDNPEFIDKTYFVVKDGATFEETFIIKKFGHILPIGMEKFATLVANVTLDDNSTEIFLDSFKKYERIDDTVNINDIDSERFLLYGKYNQNTLQSSFLEEVNIPFVAQRRKISDCIEYIKNGKDIIIQGDLGNGKSIFLEMLKFKLSVHGYDIYFLSDDFDGDSVSDIELIESKGKESIVIIDDFSNYLHLINHINETKPSNIRLVLTERSLSSLNALNNFNMDFFEVNINNLDENEIKSIIRIIDNLGVWNSFSCLTMDRKVDKIKNKYNSQLSFILLGLLDSDNIKNKISKQTDEIYKNDKYKDTVFAICLCEAINIKANASLISELLVDNNEIFTTKLRNNKEFRTLFSLVNGDVKSKSSVLALSLLNNSFSDSYIVNKLLSIVKKLDDSKIHHDNFSHIQKTLLRFRFVEMILPKKKSALNKYYEQLKINCNWLMRSPHYWVQYAMCRLAFDDYKKAQDYLTTAYEQAKNKNKDYYTDDIDTQQSRLYLNKAISISDNIESFKLFEKAHLLLSKLPNDGRKFRQIILYKDIFDIKYQRFSGKQKVAFEHSVKHALYQADQAIMGDLDPRVIYDSKQMKFINFAERDLLHIINEIKTGRENKKIKERI